MAQMAENLALSYFRLTADRGPRPYGMAGLDCRIYMVQLQPLNRTASDTSFVREKLFAAPGDPAALVVPLVLSAI